MAGRRQTRAEDMLDFGSEPSGAGAQATNPVVWSYRRRGVFEQCLLRYFFGYYTGSIVDPGLQATVRKLKHLENRFMRSGSVVHLMVKTYFKKAKEGKRLSKDFLKSWARELLTKDRTYSMKVRSGSPLSTEKFAPALLQEVYYDDPQAESLLDVAEKQVIAAIDHFFDSERFAAFRSGGVRSDSFVEQRVHLSGFPVRATGQVDLAFDGEAHASVVDWKLGAASEDGTDSLQLALYAFWAMGKFGKSSESLRVYKSHLGTNEVVEFAANERVLANARGRICQDVQRMTLLHSYGKNGDQEAFTPCAQPGICRLCGFRQVCSEGRAHIHAGN